MARWTSEEAILAELERLNDASEQLAREYADLAQQAAEAEATHKSLRAQRALSARVRGERSATAAEAVADADVDVSEALLARLVTAAQADATKESLRTCRTNQDGLRTAVASHRAMFAGPGYQR